ncbi:MAG: N-acetyltransferase [Alphaproteobacteria bacterium]
MNVREAGAADAAAIDAILHTAFDSDVEAGLVRDLVADPTAAPSLSLIAEDDAGTAVGHVLFSHVRIEGAAGVRGAILAPLAVVPGAQGKGAGRALVETGLRWLAAAGADLVFVLGDPAYYGRFGFAPAAPHGLAAPYTLPPAYAEAWMVRALRDDVPDVASHIVCADALMRPELWQE